MAEDENDRGLSRTDVAAYIFGILLTLSGVGALSEGLAGALGGSIFVFTGLLMIPLSRPILLGLLSAVSALFDGPNFLNIGRGVFIVIIVAGVVSGSVIIPSSDGNEASAPVSTSTTPELTETATEQPTDTLSSTQTEGTSTPVTTETSLDEGVAVEIVSITDGDTMDVRFPDGSIETIRLLGVDTPETSVTQVEPDDWGMKDTTDSRDWLANWGEKATNYAEERLSGEIYIKTDPEADRRGYYGRLLVYAYQSESSDISFNRRLLENGYARYYSSQFSKQSTFKKAESEARASSTGAWGYSKPTNTETESSSGSPNIVVASVHADANGNDHENLNDEYIVLKNTGDGPVNMGGWTVSDEADHRYRVPDGVKLGPSETVTIYTGSGSDTENKLYWGSDSAIWNNEGDTIIVKNDKGKIIIRYEY